MTASVLVWSVVATAQSPQTAYFITPTRLWELGAGALLAFAVPVLPRLSAAVAQVAASAGLALVLLTVVAVAPRHPVAGDGGPAARARHRALLVAAGTSGHATVAGRLLSLPPMVWVGGISYSIYLVHWPLLVLVEEPQRGTRGRWAWRRSAR